MEIKRITKKESSEARQLANKLLQCLQKSLKKRYLFVAKLVGSVCWNTILKEKGKPWDVDYQILLLNTSEEYLNNKFNNPTQIKNDFFNYFNELLKNKNGFRVENSTTAITVINKNSGYSFDFVIIKDKSQIIRRNNNDKSGRNIYTWNKLKKYNQAYDSLNQLDSEEKRELIEKYVLPRKVKEKRKLDNDPSKKSSCEIFIEEVNNYVSRKRNSRL